MQLLSDAMVILSRTLDGPRDAKEVSQPDEPDEPDDMRIRASMKGFQPPEAVDYETTVVAIDRA